jgi:hypothetical protein
MTPGKAGKDVEYPKSPVVDTSIGAVTSGDETGLAD